METEIVRRTGWECCLLSEHDQLTDMLEQLDPELVFFPHWSYQIPKSIYTRWECVIFHMTDLPFGRGGSPLQNLIVRGIRESKISALRCVADLDAGPIYLKRPLSLQGSAQDIYVTVNAIIEDMIVEIITVRPQPQPQSGEPVTFSRRTPQQGNMRNLRTLVEAYDYIRMLDAEGYPPAFLETDTLRLEFSRASMKGDRIVADVTIRRKVQDAD
jgi:methionyl-tRNA formyltransferase